MVTEIRIGFYVHTEGGSVCVCFCVWGIYFVSLRLHCKLGRNSSTIRFILLNTFSAVSFDSYLE